MSDDTGAPLKRYVDEVTMSSDETKPREWFTTAEFFDESTLLPEQCKAIVKYVNEKLNSIGIVERSAYDALKWEYESLEKVYRMNREAIEEQKEKNSLLQRHAYDALRERDSQIGAMKKERDDARSIYHELSRFNKILDAERDRLAAENKRMREALEEISKAEGSGDKIACLMTIGFCAKTARECLESLK